jgi:hypothetical protein
LVSTFKLPTPSGKWIGYQIIGGSGQGLGMQMVRDSSVFFVKETSRSDLLIRPLAVRCNSKCDFKKHNVIALAFIVFMQNLGGAMVLAMAQTIFSQDLASGLAKFAPNINAGMVEAAGLTGFRDMVQPAQVLGVVMAYDSAVTKNFYLAVVCAGGTLHCYWGMGWVNIRKMDAKP